jgi:hypothetical protein
MALRLARPGAGRKEAGWLRRMAPGLRDLLGWSGAYGGLGFAAGFVFGALRQLVLIPAFGDRAGHLIEFPMVTLTVFGIGAWIGARSAAPGLAIGILGAAILIAMESTMSLTFAGLSLSDYLASYDVKRGALLPFGLATMVLAPLAGRWSSRL